ncbi:MAG TPA: sodium:proton antiporter NhaD [Bacteroidia bacterium]|nr:sodium:proton antiporter NhaD [Bacteroidia bacterium]
MTLELTFHVNKAASALITAVLCWTVFILFTPDKHDVNETLIMRLGDLSGILFFLLGAMAIVELIDLHHGFDIITVRITATNKVRLLWIICILAFFLSALLDNLTTTIVIIALLKKLIKDDTDRMLFSGMVVIAANAGGAWSPIGDVTTTMLWIGGQISAPHIIAKLILPSLFCLLVPLFILSFKLKGSIERMQQKENGNNSALSRRKQYIVFFSGLLVLIFVPVFKTITHLPPYMGILFGLGTLWVITEIIHRKTIAEEKNNFSVVSALQKIDTPSILFFLGILLSVSALQTAGILTELANWMDVKIANQNTISILMGLLSAIIDNVPLVAATQGMYPVSVYHIDHNFWHLLAYCTGTGGSTLIIGSAAGVAAMGIEKISFMWYLKKMTLLALVGYFSGFIIYLIQLQFL